MIDEFLIDAAEDEAPLTGEQLRALRTLAGLSRSDLEREAGLTAGRIRSVENGYLRLRRAESIEIRGLLLGAMTRRAAAIAEHLRSVGSAHAEAPAADHPG
jgi:transcriptional regulator with XRE-family HTH domain